MIIDKYSVGIGDRFARQGKAQLRGVMQAAEHGVTVCPVWNKSHREHTIIGTRPGDVRREADDAVAALGWKGAYFVDADHIGMRNVDLFIDACDFFTLDVADFIGKAVDEDDARDFVARHSRFTGRVSVPGIADAFELGEERALEIARKFLGAVREAGRTYRHIAAARGEGAFVTEVSMDETDEPQTPAEMLFILAAIADERIPAQTVAPKFSGRFNKGVDYVGDAAQFAREFEQDLAVIAFAVREFALPAQLKLSIHSGSDKFSIYGAMGRAIRRADAGLHLKTAGTTWLEELIGLARGGSDGLALAKDVYREALGRYEELCGPYATVIDIDRAKLPSAGEVGRWSGEDFAAAVRHDPSDPAFDPNVRQLLHVGYKVAAEMGDRYLNALDRYETVVADGVTENIFERHVKPLFVERTGS